ncbi:MAG TPA: PleD family two-component system response regulator [Alphaproteobacteria bacterium]|jgi:two-component system cell cycle response regulator|nr:PleD family two-component system response regulator [Alphaproteobacteria bacterium]
MSARILVVDDLLPNVKLLEAKLAREYFDVRTAMNGRDALEAVEREKPDIVLLDVMMPEMDGFEVCRRLKANPETAHIPVVMVTALNDTADRVQGLEVGADDFLTKPINDTALLARVRSLVRLKMMMDELRLREKTSSSFGVTEPTAIEIDAENGHILVVEDREIYARNIEKALGGSHSLVVTDDPETAAQEARSGGLDLIVVSLGLRQADGLRLCSQFRSMDSARQTPLLMLVDESPEEMERLVKGLDLGVNDYLIRPIDANELKARCRTQIRRKRYQDRLRANYHMSIELAVTDTLTGLYSRNYLETHLDNVVRRALGEGKPVSVLLLDIDHFKKINDTYGHAAGDEVLREFSARVQRSVRGMDLAARLGGEEFVVVMPETDAADACGVAERLCRSIAEKPFQIVDASHNIPVTVSIGAVVNHDTGDSAAELLKRADQALYQAKGGGRNRVVLWHESEPRVVAVGA